MIALPMWQGIVFCSVFLAVSGLFGPRVVGGGILFRDGFAAYGEIGKVLFFGLLAAVLLIQHTKKSVALRPWRPLLLLWGGGAAVLLGVSWLSIGQLLAGHDTWLAVAGAHGGLLGGMACALLACFGSSNLGLLWNAYRREWSQAAITAGLFYLFLEMVYRLWQPLATVVLTATIWLLKLTGLSAVLAPHHTLIFDKFSITVSQYCSGIESIALFTGLYIVVGLLDWQRFNKQRFVLFYGIGLLLLSVLNIGRIYGLIIAGYYINPQIAFSLFHTYAGLVFFVLYSAGFWSVAYKHMITPDRVLEST